ncbi:hypothetical protein ACJRO7_034683 [Eucalyptus globulus]|uniref:C2 domain-containing protein n=1 Tax=Eucalyptus globulus TaxID=34317 RepID=A0ABD3J3K2_EUCGL
MQQYHLSTVSSNPQMSIQGQLLEVTVVGCTKLKDTEWISRQDPYVCLEYGSTKFRTRTCTDGGKNPTFQEKFVFTLIEGLRELNLAVWNSNTLTYDDFIGIGKVQLHKALSQGFDDTTWPLQTKTGRYAGEARVILHYANAIKPATSSAPSAPPFVASSAPPHVSMYYAPPPPSAHPYGASATAYPATAPAYPLYAPNPAAYPSHPPNPAAYPPPPYFSPPPSAYPPPAYPPPPAAYPPPSYPPPPGPPGHYPGHYPPPPY